MHPESAVRKTHALRVPEQMFEPQALQCRSKTHWSPSKAEETATDDSWAISGVERSIEVRLVPSEAEIPLCRWLGSDLRHSIHR